MCGGAEVRTRDPGAEPRLAARTAAADTRPPVENSPAAGQQVPTLSSEHDLGALLSSAHIGISAVHVLAECVYIDS